MNESAITLKFRKALVARGAWCIKLSDRFHANYPDLIGVYRGSMFAVEMKVKPNTPSAGQYFELSCIASACGRAFVGTYNKKDKKIILKEDASGTITPGMNIEGAAAWLLNQISSNIKQQQLDVLQHPQVEPCCLNLD